MTHKDADRTLGDVYLGDQNLLFECWACGRRAVKHPGSMRGFPETTIKELLNAAYCSSCGNTDIEITEVIWARERKSRDDEWGPEPDQAPPVAHKIEGARE